jgi:hypothetical protein
MSALLPPSTNDQYRGSRYAAWFLAFYGITWIVPGLIHSFLPDGGAGTIAGLDLSHNPTMIFGMFAWAGATQIAPGHYGSLISLPVILLCLWLSVRRTSLNQSEGLE